MGGRPEDRGVSRGVSGASFHVHIVVKHDVMHVLLVEYDAQGSDDQQPGDLLDTMQGSCSHSHWVGGWGVGVTGQGSQ